MEEQLGLKMKTTDMKLTGKAKELFEEWYFSLPNAMGLNYGTIALTMNRFYSLPLSMQWGVYQDWADSMWYRVDVLSETVLEIGTLHGFTISKVEKKSVSYYPYTNTFYDDLDSLFGCVWYEEARNAALQKLNEIINKG